MNQRYLTIKEAFVSWPYNGLFVVFSLSFLFFTVRLNKSYVLLNNLASFSSWYALFFIMFLLLSSLLVALTINLTIIRFRSTRMIGVRSSSTSAVGVLSSILGSGCPACFIGVFPAVMGFFGFSLSLADLPFLGLELQGASVILLGVSVHLLSGPMVCKPKKSKFKTAR